MALTFLVYLPARSAPFVSDDRLAISDNEWVTGSLRPLAIFSHFSWWGAGRADAPGYRPLVTLSFAVERAWMGLQPVWFHAANFVWHAVVATLVYLLALRLRLSHTAAAVAAVIFCVLPIHSEAVIWSVGRAELMAAAGFTAALILLLAYRERGSSAALLCAAATLLAALFCKENAVTLLAAPAAAALILPSTTATRRRDGIATGTLLAILAVYVSIRSIAGPLVGSAAGDRLDNPLSVLPGIERMFGVLSVLGRYLKLSVWPHPLSIDYSYDALGIDRGFHGDGYTWFALAACAALACLGWRVRRRAPGVAYGLVLAALTYSIVSNTVIVIGTAMAERLFYLPTVGLCLAVAPALAWPVERFGRRGYLVAGMLACACAATVLVRAGDWQSPVSIFEAAARVYPRSARAQMEVASAYGHAGRTAEAIAAFERATEIMPDYAAAWYNLGNLHAREGRYAEAEKAYRKALEHAPHLNAARYNLALVLTSEGRTAEAVEVLRPGLDSNSQDAVLAMTLADAYYALGRNEEAAATYAAALRIDPDLEAAHLRRAWALQRSSGCEAALPDFLAYLQRRPGDTAVVRQAVFCLQTAGRQAEARDLIDRAQVANRNVGR